MKKIIWIACSTLFSNIHIVNAWDQTDGDDFIEASNGDDEIDGRGGDDLIYGFAGDDDIDGGFGNDKIYGGPGKDNIHGDYYDVPYSGGDDVIYGEDGNDRLFGGEGSDSIYGGPGDDILVKFPNNAISDYDYYSGGSGNDRLVVAERSKGVVEFHGGVGTDELELNNTTADDFHIYVFPGGRDFFMAHKNGEIRIFCTSVETVTFKEVYRHNLSWSWPFF